MLRDAAEVWVFAWVAQVPAFRVSHSPDPVQSTIPALFLVEFASEKAFFNKFESMKCYFSHLQKRTIQPKVHAIPWDAPQEEVFEGTWITTSAERLCIDGTIVQVIFLGIPLLLASSPIFPAASPRQRNRQRRGTTGIFEHETLCFDLLSRWWFPIIVLIAKGCRHRKAVECKVRPCSVFPGHGCVWHMCTILAGSQG